MDNLRDAPRYSAKVRVRALEAADVEWQRELIASLKQEGLWELARQVQAALDRKVAVISARENKPLG